MSGRNYILTPGLQSSRGNQIIPSLCALLMKIRELKQSLLSDRELDDEANSDNSQSQLSNEAIRDLEDRLIRDVRLKLLTAQIYVIGCLLRDKYPKRTKNATTNTDEAMFFRPQTTNGTNVFDDDLDQIPVKLMPTDNNKFQATDDAVKGGGCFSSGSSSIVDQIPKYERQKYNDERMQLQPIAPKSSTLAYSQSTAREPSVKKRHFHMTLSKVPFILGTVRRNCSTSPSHSLIANVQNMISTLKMHCNVCAPSQASTSRVYNTPRSRREQDSNIVLKNLAKDFSTLSREQEKLKEQLFANKDRPVRKLTEKYKNISELLQTTAKEIVKYHTLSESEKVSTRTSLKTRQSSESLSVPQWK